MTPMAGVWMLNYLRATGTQYTRGALTSVLLASGHDQADIDAAWAELEAEGLVPPELPRRSRRPRSVFRGLALGVGYVMGVFAVLVGVLSFQRGSPVPVVVGAVVVGIAGWLVALRRDQSVAFGVVAGVVLTLLIPAMLVLGLLGVLAIQP